MAKAKDITGQRFGRLVAVKRSEQKSRNGTAFWECVCDCGEKTEVASANLLAGKIRSCGCIAKENGTKECVENTNLNKLNSIPQKNNTSGRKGVTKVGEYWKAYIGFQKRIIYLGTYKKFEDAVKARARAEEEYFEPMLNKYGKEWKGE